MYRGVGGGGGGGLRRGTSSAGENSRTPPISVRGSPRDTSTPPTVKKCGVVLPPNKAHKHSRRRPTSHSQAREMDGRDDETERRHPRSSTRPPPPERKCPKLRKKKRRGGPLGIPQRSGPEADQGRRTCPAPCHAGGSGGADRAPCGVRAMPCPAPAPPPSSGVSVSIRP